MCRFGSVENAEITLNDWSSLGTSAADDEDFFQFRHSLEYLR